ncbi:MAG: sugar ABC transporter permease [Oscillospiraceae bacterium]|nr:sugar ABC transporter permease [Oscillospiraceae bacterium]
MNTNELKTKNRDKNSDAVWSWIFMTPTTVFLVITALIPLLYSVYISFFKLKMNLPNATPTFVGFANYARMLTDKTLRVATSNTFKFAFISVTLELILGLFVAMAFCSDRRWARLGTSILLVPMIMAPVAIGTLWRMMLDGNTGVINYLLSFLGIESVNWLSNPKYAMPAVLFVNVWQLVPWVVIVAAAGLKALPGDCLEAALVDGASNRQIFWHIVLPMISPLLVIIYMLRFVDAFKVFDTVYTMTNGGPGTATEMLPNYIYKQGMKYFDVGYTAALAIAFVLVMSLFTAIFLRIRRKVEERVQ